MPDGCTKFASIIVEEAHNPKDEQLSVAPNFTSIIVEEAHNPKDEQHNDKILAQQYHVQEETAPTR